MNNGAAKPLLFRQARPTAATRQDTLASRYPGWVRVLAMTAFTLAFLGWLNESWLFLWESPIWLNRYTEYVIILGFGLWRIHAERSPYTRRLIILVAVVTLFWWLVPWLSPFFEPYVGFLWSQPVFPSLHTPGTLTFFLVLTLVFLFGRRVICGFGCPCVGIRETVGFAYRDRTLRGKWVWRLRHVKWLFFVWYVGVMVATQFPPTAWTVSLVGLFGLTVGLTYFGSFLLVPLTGNRFYCRYLCPYGATFGLLNHAGFYGVEMDPERCIDCRRCDQACDMGIPVRDQGKEHGRVTGLEDCIGCARCVISCPTDALAIRDVRNLFRPALRQSATRLLGAPPVTPAPRFAPPERPPAERTGDWCETYAAPDLSALAKQAARCLDCGVPGCRNACPLGNRIPDWLAAAASGDFSHAADLAHDTNPLPELCGRLCPQHRLCESACARGRMEGAVTIGAVEGAILDRALAAARQDAVCTGCHGGAVAHSYATSKHGVLVRIGSPDWTLPLCRGDHRSPGCAYCHLHDRDHRDTMDPARGQAVREWVCSACHAPRYVSEQLAAGDRLTEIARTKVQEAEELALRHPDGVTAIADHLESVDRHLANVRLGAGHQSPDYQRWHGQPALDGDLIRLRHEVAQALRQPVVPNPVPAQSGVTRR